MRGLRGSATAGRTRRMLTTLGACSCAALLAASSASAASKAASTKTQGSVKTDAPRSIAARSDSSAAPAKASATSPAGEAPPDSMVLRGGRQGTVFQSLTVEGEDRIRIEFDRPALDLDLDPKQASGLDWDKTGDVLERGALVLDAPFLRSTALERSPYLGRPWLGRFRSGSVVRFRPAVEGVDRWRLTVADSRGRTVATSEGQGRSPREIPWDGRGLDGAPVAPGLTYSYVFEAHDRAGNKRNFVGEGFTVPPYRYDAGGKLTLLFPGAELSGTGVAGASAPSPILLEAADWLNHSGRTAGKVTVRVTARSFEQASALADQVAQGLKPLLLGDPSRIATATDVQPDAAATGSVAIQAGTAGAERPGR